EGRKTALDTVSSVETSLFIDPSWDNTAVRAGIWATGNGAIAEWGIIEYTTVHGYVQGSLTKSATFRTWNSTTGVWTPVMEAVAGETYTLRVEVADGSWYYFINDTLVGEVEVDGTDTKAIKEVILNHYNFGIESPATGDEFGNRAYTVQWSDMNVTHSYETFGAAVADAEEGDVVVLNEDSVETSTVLIDKSITVMGNGNTVTAGGELTGSVVLITGSDVSINDLVVDGASKTVHGLQAYTASNVTLNGLTVQNNGKSGLLVNGSTVTVTNLTTSGNTWNGVNVDRGVNVTSPAVLTVNGTSAHDEVDAIWVDDIAKADVTVVDTESQYDSSERAYVKNSTDFTGRVYVLAPEPVVEETRRSSRSGQSRSSSSNNTGTVAGASTGPVGQVLGASTYNFTGDLTIGSTGADVNALQAMLIASGHLSIATPTGYFGPLTQAALAKWQAAHGVAPASGYFGPLTRAAVAASATPAMTDEARAALLVELLKQVADLQEKLNEMIADEA
ncbi:MAG: peptidoglycan-binding protein, partial [Nitrospirota bacterium]|nr:peptidoglycan-binding protein [Nitrospirota bacterium]